MAWDWKLLIGVPSAVLALLGIQRHLAAGKAERVQSARVEARRTDHHHKVGYSESEIVVAGADAENWRLKSARSITFGAKISISDANEDIDIYGNTRPLPQRWDEFAELHGYKGAILTNMPDCDVTIEFTLEAKSDPTETMAVRLTIKAGTPPADVHPA